MYGMNVHKQLLKIEKETGITFVNENYDEGGLFFNKSCFSG
jgi:hypothetical protein